MGETTAIEWTDASWNPLRARRWHLGRGTFGWHCEHVSEGCRNCYAETMNKRLGTGLDYKPGNLEPRGPVTPFLDEKLLLAPLKWRKPKRIFLSSMTDIFGDWVSDADLDRIFAVMALCPQHVFQVLTKRPERMRDYLADDGMGRVWETLSSIPTRSVNYIELTPKGPIVRGVPAWPLPNVWLGVSVEDQAAADARIPLLLDTPAAKRFLSCEPLLGAVDLTAISTLRFRGAEMLDAMTGTLSGMFGDPCGQQLPSLDWVIAGGESGPGARPMHPDWARSLRDQCAAAGVPFLFKQWGEWAIAEFDTHEATHWFGPEGLRERGKGAPWGIGDISARRVGKKRAGRLLDGAQHDGMPA